MMFQVRMLTAGTYEGRTIESAVRKAYGPDAVARKSADINDPHWGQVVQQVDVASWMVLDTIREVEKLTVGDAEELAPIRELGSEIYEAKRTLEALEREMEQRIIQAHEDGATDYAISQATGYDPNVKGRGYTQPRVKRIWKQA
ncbi:hypothetical protein WG936_05560 [Corynebacterium sp. H127]|uniref:hypothetical protein n=1 Tax=Corynebacterium sp. H127 TaxID=3133418 RepID=UPI0030ABEB48